ncbi:membrane protein [Klebsiella michiganensis]|uniref:Membrane protein n=1 Tax=Klebsiella michiganensis TaxID=1134687 RepID=A0A7H4N7H5_9ENTR|nr:membrane protein [Klebsiella michiganensis]
MTLPFKPHLLALLCSAGLLAAAGTLYVKSREPQTVPEPPAVAQTAQATAAAQPVTTTYYTRADRPVGRANRALSGQSAVAGC